jgi:hypothetical protein
MGGATGRLDLGTAPVAGDGPGRPLMGWAAGCGTGPPDCPGSLAGGTTGPPGGAAGPPSGAADPPGGWGRSGGVEDSVGGAGVAPSRSALVGAPGGRMASGVSGVSGDRLGAGAVPGCGPDGEPGIGGKPSGRVSRFAADRLLTSGSTGTARRVSTLGTPGPATSLPGNGATSGAVDASAGTPAWLCGAAVGFGSGGTEPCWNAGRGWRGA